MVEPAGNLTTPLLKNGFDLPKKVGILFSDVKREYFPTEEQYITEKNADEDAKLIAKYLENLGTKVNLYPGNALLPEKLKKDRPELVINLVDSVKGYESLASTIPALLELLEIPYTGADILGMSLDTNKFLIKKLLMLVECTTMENLMFDWTNQEDTFLSMPIVTRLLVPRNLTSRFLQSSIYMEFLFMKY